MQAGKKLVLEGPLELGVVEIARMHAEVVGMHRHGGIAEIDDDLDALTLLARVERQQRVLVQLELIEDALQARIGALSRLNCTVMVCRSIGPIGLSLCLGFFTDRPKDR